MKLGELLKKHNFKFSKKYGQNFLSDGNLLESIYANGLHIFHSEDGGIKSMNCPDGSIVECK